MSVLAWIVLGLVAGFIASKIVNSRGEGLFLDVVLGIVGARGWMAVRSLRGKRGERCESIQPACSGGRRHRGFVYIPRTSSGRLKSERTRPNMLFSVPNLQRM
jgi:uncharacterized membrane protein YeaQ/YmgE (transglycosylase-associated protein family)